MSKEVLKLALAFIEAEGWGDSEVVITAINQALAQPAQHIPDLIHHTDLSETLEYITGWNDCRQAILAEQPAQQEPVGPEPFGYFQYDIRLDAWVQNRVNNKGVAFYIKEQK